MKEQYTFYRGTAVYFIELLFDKVRACTMERVTVLIKLCLLFEYLLMGRQGNAYWKVETVTVMFWVLVNVRMIGGLEIRSGLSQSLSELGTGLGFRVK